ncbi:MAG: methylenetetrahydrofolate reductase [NAD(P)H] [Phycisphaerales bacterium]|nr:MAG: methylenetetrahydrofolate reductase [NAD(P)H] [Phycisphaerales bacterium]
MHLRDIFKSHHSTFSFEFFPPKTAEGANDLFESIRELESLRPTFVSATYGAGGSTRDLTHNLVVRLKSDTSLDPVPHLTCVGHDEREVGAILERYAAAGISNILALRGDVPKSIEGSPWKSFHYAGDLVRFIKKFADKGIHPDSRGFGIAVAGFPEGHPETPNRLVEIDRLKAKVDEGADAIITQLFFDNRDFYDFRARCEMAGIKVPIVAGIMPITSTAGMKRMAELALGARYPASLLRALNRAGGDEDGVRRVGIHWATEQSRDLLDHDVAGIHFYTLNRSTATREIYATLGVKDSSGLRR